MSWSVIPCAEMNLPLTQLQCCREQNQSIEQMEAAGYRKEDVERVTRLIEIKEYNAVRHRSAFASRIAPSDATGVSDHLTRS